MYSEKKQQEIDNLEFAAVGRAKNLTGQKFGRWTVLGRAPKKDKAAYWWCICDCENHTIAQVCGSHLTCNQSQSCGCLNKEIVRKIGKQAKKDLTGQTFGHLTVVKDSGKRAHNRTVIWECKCDCGNTLYVRSDILSTGHTQSCGCASQSRGEEIIEKILKTNNIQYKKEYAFSDLKTEKGGILRFDFAIFKNNQLQQLIEFDGEQHFKEIKGSKFKNSGSLEERQNRDRLKNDYCKEHNIKLVRVPYYDIGKISLKTLGLEEF